MVHHLHRLHFEGCLVWNKRTPQHIWFGGCHLANLIATGDVTIKASMNGLDDGYQGFHIHIYGDIVGSDDGMAAAGHYNPNDIDHPGPDDTVCHLLREWKG